MLTIHHGNSAHDWLERARGRELSGEEQQRHRRASPIALVHAAEKDAVRAQRSFGAERRR